MACSAARLAISGRFFCIERRYAHVKKTPEAPDCNSPEARSRQRRRECYTRQLNQR